MDRIQDRAEDETERTSRKHWTTPRVIPADIAEETDLTLNPMHFFLAS